VWLSNADKFDRSFKLAGTLYVTFLHFRLIYLLSGVNDYGWFIVKCWVWAWFVNATIVLSCLWECQRMAECNESYINYNIDEMGNCHLCIVLLMQHRWNIATWFYSMHGCWWTGVIQVPVIFGFFLQEMNCRLAGFMSVIYRWLVIRACGVCMVWSIH